MQYQSKTWEKNGYILRLAQKSDANEYYNNNFNPLNPEIVRLTGCKESFTQDEVVSFLKKCVDATDRYDFLILDPKGNIIGESVLNEIDESLKSANFRIAIFHSKSCSKGIGSWAIEKTLEFAFETIKLHRVELDVFSFNPRAIRAYEKAGFKHEGRLRDAIKDGNSYADDLLMSILQDEWKKEKTKIKK